MYAENKVTFCVPFIIQDKITVTTWSIIFLHIVKYQFICICDIKKS